MSYSNTSYGVKKGSPQTAFYMVEVSSTISNEINNYWISKWGFTSMMYDRSLMEPFFGDYLTIAIF